MMSSYSIFIVFIKDFLYTLIMENTLRGNNFE